MSSPPPSSSSNGQPSKKRRITRRSRRSTEEGENFDMEIEQGSNDDTLELQPQAVVVVLAAEAEEVQDLQPHSSHSSSSSLSSTSSSSNTSTNRNPSTSTVPDLVSHSQMQLNTSGGQGQPVPPPFRPFELGSNQNQNPRPDEISMSSLRNPTLAPVIPPREMVFVPPPPEPSTASSDSSSSNDASISNQQLAIVELPLALPLQASGSGSGPGPHGSGSGSGGFMHSRQMIPANINIEHQHHQQQQPLRLLPQPPTTALTHQSRIENHGWQESRLKLTERAKFLLNNPRMSDIRFIVGESRTDVYGHKTLLAMGSPVFEAQFYGSLHSSEETIELPEFEPETFLLFLKYLYTDTLDEPIDDMKILQLLKPAKKYIVPHLIEKCSDILMSELRPENVFQIHNYADFFDLTKLEGACLRFIDRECEALIQTEEFNQLPPDAITQFLQRDGLNIKEGALFKAVLRWAELECERKNVEPTDANIRTALGENLKLVRFPTMTPEEFAADVAVRSILTPEEANSIFIFMCIGYPNRLNPTFVPAFPIKKRGFYPQQYLVSRFSGEPQPHSLNYRSGEIYTYRFNIKADRQIFFKGVNIFSIKCGPNAQYADQRRFNGAVYLYECDAVVGDRDLTREKARKQFSKDTSLESEYETSSGSRYFPVLFDQEIRIPANQLYTVCAVVSVASSSYHQQPLNTFMGTDEADEVSVICANELQVNFTFSNCYGEASVGKYTQSQIPEIVFSL